MTNWSQKIGIKSGLSALFAIIAILLIEAFFSWSYSRYELNRNFETEANSLLSASAESMILPVWDLDIQTLDGMAEALTQNTHVEAVSLVDPSGIVLTQHRNSSAKSKNPLTISADIEAAYNRNSSKTATLTIVYTRAQIHSELTYMAWKSIIRAMFFCVLFFGVLLLTIRSLILPIKSLEKTFREYDGRKSLVRVPGENREDEFGSLARSFRKMASQIHESFTTLDSRVERRTRELNNAVQEAFRINKELENAALHDSLTRLPNRLFVSNYLEEKIKVAKHQNGMVTVAHIDLDNFKEINDTYGHSAGDFVLVELANKMAAHTNEDKVIARVGGDEFLLIFSVDQDEAQTMIEIETLLQSLFLPMNFEGITLQTSASVGVSYFPDCGENVDDLIVNADLALYEAKEDGRGLIRFFEKPMRETFDWRKKLEAEMVVGLEKGHFIPYFQAQVDISNGKISGVETLARWKHPTRGVVSPLEFLPVAERAGFMVDLGRQIFEAAIILASEWYLQGIEFGRLALNASAIELGEFDFVDWLLETANKHGLPAARLSIEILETVMIENDRLNLSDTLRRLRKAGIFIELDDFGTGYASLQQIKADEIDRIKIDRGFIENIDVDKNKCAIVKAIVEMTRTMGIEIIAEGAETKNELDTLLKFGCHTVQGFSIAPPMPPSVMANWMTLFSRNENRQKGHVDGVISFPQRTAI